MWDEEGRVLGNFSRTEALGGALEVDTHMPLIIREKECGMFVKTDASWCPRIPCLMCLILTTRKIFFFYIEKTYV